MVVRKPVPSTRTQASKSAPYSVASTAPGTFDTTTPAYQADTYTDDEPTQPQFSSAGLDALNATNEWASEESSMRRQENGLFLTSRAGGTTTGADPKQEADLPPSLQIGSANATPRSSFESQRSANAAARQTGAEAAHGPKSTNPYRRIHSKNTKAPETPKYGEESSVAEWSDHERPSSGNSFPTNMPKYPPPDPPSQQRLHADTYAQLEGVMYQEPPTEPDAKFYSADSVQDNEKVPCDTENSAFRNQSHWPEHQGSNSDQLDSGEKTLVAGAPILGEWQADQNNKIQFQTREKPGRDSPPPSYIDEPHIPLPARNLQPQEYVPSLQPPKHPKTKVAPVQDDLIDTTSARLKRASETYQIRLVNWFDVSSQKNPRRSPIMVQNANGPCPLLALVNALVLSTPADITTVLIETLRVREQVSLGLLLDAVIEELMSDRRGGSAGNLPDVSDLYEFLVTLHTGMNVNPRFVSSEGEISLLDISIDSPANSEELRKPGCFEETREMKLYSTFTIPLIHGWIVPRIHPAFEALKRTARTYEDAQNIMFREEELEDKLGQQGLSQEEQLILEDIANIKYFLSSTATQLTGYGLDTITEALSPGSISILFRNDHFSTLYKQPRSGQLLTLVTDMGYVGHDEVVWESLVDVHGEGCEFFAGDFRPVGNVAGDIQQPSVDASSSDDAGWTTVSSGRSRNQPRSNDQAFQKPRSYLPPLETLGISDDTSTFSPKTEQEDHDLALAMQLQEEEEERDRQEAAARRRENELSQAYLNSSDGQGRRTFPGFGRGAQNSPAIPPRGRGGGGGESGRPIPSARQPPRRESLSDEAPPSYEQAAKGPAYYPPANHPAHPHASPGPSGSSPRPMPTRQSGWSTYSEHAAAYAGPSSTLRGSGRGSMARERSSNLGGGVGPESAPGNVRRRSGNANALANAATNAPSGIVEEEKREKDCVVM